MGGGGETCLEGARLLRDGDDLDQGDSLLGHGGASEIPGLKDSLGIDLGMFRSGFVINSSGMCSP